MPPRQALTKPTPLGAQGAMLWTVGKLKWGGTCFIYLYPYFCPISMQTSVLKDFIKSMCQRLLLRVSEDITVSVATCWSTEEGALCLCSFCKGRLLSWELDMAGVGAVKVWEGTLVHSKKACQGETQESVTYLHDLLPLWYSGSACLLLLLPPLQLCWHHFRHYVRFMGTHSDLSQWSELN